jgi:hypothetical protein
MAELFRNLLSQHLLDTLRLTVNQMRILGYDIGQIEDDVQELALFRDSPEQILDAVRRLEQNPDLHLSRAVVSDDELRKAAPLRPVPGGNGALLCGWCEKAPVHGKAYYCSNACRQAAYRLRVRTEQAGFGPFDRSMRLAYADPPFPGMAELYRNEASYGGEVDHRELIDRLLTFDGWALSTSVAALPYVLSLCPPDCHVHPWVKPIGVSAETYGAHNAWEALIVKPARERQPGFRDWLYAMPARGGGEDLIGRKPIAFAAYLFRALGADTRDVFVDFFPGTGIVSRCWMSWRAQAAAERTGK